jgi:NTP pyrophosphatase (non-canonical NTP hydrolase)
MPEERIDVEKAEDAIRRLTIRVNELRTECADLREQKERIDIFDLHQRLTAHLFPSYSNTDERFVALGLCGEVGELANMIKKRWRDGVDLTEEIREEIADIRVYLELMTKCFDIEGSKLDDRVQQKLEKVGQIDIMVDSSSTLEMGS